MELPNLEVTASFFIYNNQLLEQIDLPSLHKTGDSFLYENRGISNLVLPNLIESGMDFLSKNDKIKKLDLPALTKAGDGYFANNKSCQRKVAKIIENNTKLTSKELAELDKESELTTTETEQGKNIIEKILEFIKGDNDQNQK